MMAVTGGGGRLTCDYYHCCNKENTLGYSLESRVPRIFHRGKTEKAERADGVLGEGQQLPPHHRLWPKGLGECCELSLSRRSSGQIDRAPSVERFSTIFSTLGGLS